MTPDLDAFQLDTLRFIDFTDGRCVIADPMGARKTGTALAWAENRNVLRTLVIAPSAVHGHWFREADKFHPYAGQYLGTGSKRKDALARCIDTAADGLPVLYVTTYETAKADQYQLTRAGFDLVIFDEGHKLKGRRTQVALAANHFAKIRQCIIVTGTPVINHPSELWQYMHMLAPKLYPAFWTWAEEHFDIKIKQFRGNRFPTRLIQDYLPGHEEIVRAQVATFMIQRPIEELFPEAPWVIEPEHVEYPVTLAPKELAAYKQLVKHHWADIEGTEVTTANGIDLGVRLEQIVSDWSGLADTEELGTKAKAATDVILNLLERDEKVLVFVKFKATAAAIQRALAARPHFVKAHIYSGDLTTKQRDELAQDFSKGKIKVLIGTLAAMSEGVDGAQMPCSNVVFVDRHWTHAKNEQAIGRLRRSGQVKRVTVHHIFAPGTVDATITAACLRKLNVVETIQGRPLSDAIYGRIT